MCKFCCRIRCWEKKFLLKLAEGKKKNLIIEKGKVKDRYEIIQVSFPIKEGKLNIPLSSLLELLLVSIGKGREGNGNNSSQRNIPDIKWRWIQSSEFIKSNVVYVFFHGKCEKWSVFVNFDGFLLESNFIFQISKKEYDFCSCLCPVCHLVWIN